MGFLEDIQRNLKEQQERQDKERELRNQEELLDQQRRLKEELEEQTEELRRQAHERDKKQKHADFGTDQYCWSCILKAIKIDGQYKATLRDYYLKWLLNYTGGENLESNRATFEKRFGMLPPEAAVQLQTKIDKYKADQAVETAKEEEEERRWESKVAQTRLIKVIAIAVVGIVIFLIIASSIHHRNEEARKSAGKSAEIYQEWFKKFDPIKVGLKKSKVISLLGEPPTGEWLLACPGSGGMDSDCSMSWAAESPTCCGKLVYYSPHQSPYEVRIYIQRNTGQVIRVEANSPNSDLHQIR